MSSLFTSITNRLEVDMESLLSSTRGTGTGTGSLYEQQSESLLGGGIRSVFETDADEVTSSTWQQQQQQQQQQEQQNDNQNQQYQNSLCPKLEALTWQERLGGCLGCMVLGYVLSFGSFFRLKDLMVGGNPGPFVVYATMGNIISLSGSFFLSGPRAQLQKMFHESRKIATCVYLGSLGVTLLVALVPLPFGRSLEVMILVLLLIFQYIAVGWYCMSYVPFARQLARRVMNSIWSRIEDWE